MGALENLLKFVSYDIWKAALEGDLSGSNVFEEYGDQQPGTDTFLTYATARRQLQYFGLGLVGLIAAPSIYAWSLGTKKKKRKLTHKEEMMGRSLENSSSQATGVIMTALAAPAISTAAAYILVQKLEDAKIITRGLGNATQGLLTIAAAGPAIQGIGRLAGSAFTKGK